MSKIEYGQEASEVANFINRIGQIEGVALCLKPNTRDMTIENLEIDTSSIIKFEYNIPTTYLIDWAGMVVFTGSSIIFEAMIKRKKVLYLSFLQKYPNIFLRNCQKN